MSIPHQTCHHPASSGCRCGGRVSSFCQGMCREAPWPGRAGLHNGSAASQLCDLGPPWVCLHTCKVGIHSLCLTTSKENFCEKHPQSTHPLAGTEPGQATSFFLPPHPQASFVLARGICGGSHGLWPCERGRTMAEKVLAVGLQLT